MTTTTFPDGTALTSTALTPVALLEILQPLVCGMLGIVPPDYNRVRLDWIVTGQPGPTIDQDICALRVTEENLDYSKFRDVVRTPNDAASLLETITYQRTWKCSLTQYGPNAEDNARILTDALFLDWVGASLANSNLYPVSMFDRPVYLRELRAGQWWTRCDLHISLNELVTATLTAPSIATAEIIAETVLSAPPVPYPVVPGLGQPTTVVADIIISA